MTDSEWAIVQKIIQYDGLRRRMDDTYEGCCYGPKKQGCEVFSEESFFIDPGIKNSMIERGLLEDYGSGGDYLFLPSYMPEPKPKVPRKPYQIKCLNCGEMRWSNEHCKFCKGYKEQGYERIGDAIYFNGQLDHYTRGKL